MELSVNGKEHHSASDQLTVSDLILELQLHKDATGIAVAVNYEVVPRSEWNSTKLKNKDKVEVITARQGG